MRLKALQHAFKTSLITTDNAVLSELDMRGKLNAAQGMSVYKNAYTVRLHNLLERALPHTSALMGDTMFRALVRGYFVMHPPAHFNAYKLPQHLCEYMRQCDLEPWLAELAQFELTMQAVMLAENVPVLAQGDISQLSEQEFDQLQLILHPQVALLEGEYAVADVWQGTVSIPEKTEQHLVVWRSGVDALYLTVTRLFWQALQALQGVTWQVWSEQFTDADELLPAVLQLALQHGWLLRCV